jgi:hypothetical protein
MRGVRSQLQLAPGNAASAADADNKMYSIWSPLNLKKFA